MPFDGSARRRATPRDPRLPPEVMTWTPRAFSPPISPLAQQWAHFLVGLGFGLALVGLLSFLFLML